MCSNSKQGYEGVLVMEAFSTAGLDCASWGASRLKIFRFSPGAAIYLLISLEGFLKIKMFLQYSVFCTGLKGGRRGTVRFKLLILVRVVSVSLHVLK